jgi:hypothetical protein
MFNLPFPCDYQLRDCPQNPFLSNSHVAIGARGRKLKRIHEGENGRQIDKNFTPSSGTFRAGAGARRTS